MLLVIGTETTAHERWERERERERGSRIGKVGKEIER